MCVARMTLGYIVSLSAVICGLFCLRTDICDGGCDSHFDTRVSFLGQFTLEELVQFGVEDTVGHEFALLGYGSLLSGHGDRLCKITREIEAWVVDMICLLFQVCLCGTAIVSSHCGPQ